MPYYFHYVDNSAQIHLHHFTEQVAVNVHCGFDVRMPDKSGNLQNIDAFVCQARYSKVAKMMESFNSIVVQGSDENALSTVAGSEACTGKLIADKRD